MLLFFFFVVIVHSFGSEQHYPYFPNFMKATLLRKKKSWDLLSKDNLFLPIYIFKNGYQIGVLSENKIFRDLFGSSSIQLFQLQFIYFCTKQFMYIKWYKAVEPFFTNMKISGIAKAYALTICITILQIFDLPIIHKKKIILQNYDFLYFFYQPISQVQFKSFDSIYFLKCVCNFFSLK